MSSPQARANRIAQLETRHLNESTSAIMVALNMNDRATADPFVKEVLQKILLQRMNSPPHTNLLCITLIGSVTAREFAGLWRKYLAGEPGLVAFVRLMQAADVIHGTPGGQVLEQVSLLGSVGAASSPQAAGGSGSPGAGGIVERLKSFFRGGRG
jgi:hypothetical protein